VIGLDANVLVRYITQDDPKQSLRATKLIDSLSAENQGFIALVAVVELVWVLQGCYDATKSEVLSVLERLLRAKEMAVENAEVVWQALHAYARSNADFSDCLIERSASSAKCIHTVTLDGKAAKSAGMVLLEL
jgi:predicted nucleic-acid-binding protein